MVGLNPYIDTNGSDALDAILTQKPIKDLTKDRFMACSKGMKTFEKLAVGQEFDEEEKELVKKLYKSMAEEILSEREKIGGNWIINHGVVNREFRDYIKSLMGPELTFVTLSLDKEEQVKRIIKRNGDNQSLIDLFTKVQSLYDSAGADEEQAFDILVSTEMKPEDVAEKIYQHCKIE